MLHLNIIGKKIKTLKLVGGIAILLSAPIVLTTFFIIAIGIGLNVGLNTLDNEMGLSASLKEKLRIALATRTANKGVE